MELQCHYSLWPPPKFQALRQAALKSPVMSASMPDIIFKLISRTTFYSERRLNNGHLDPSILRQHGGLCLALLRGVETDRCMTQPTDLGHLPPQSVPEMRWVTRTHSFLECQRSIHCGLSKQGRCHNASTTDSPLKLIQLITLAHQNNLTRLHNSVCQAPTQVQQRPFTVMQRWIRICPECGDHGSSGGGRDRACPSSRDEEMKPLLHWTEERWWVWS